MNNMAFSEIVVIKLLFFVQNNFGCKSFSVLQGLLVNFYSEESICIAREKIQEVGVRLLGDKVLKLKDHRIGDNKKRLDVQDLLEIFAESDK